MANDFEVQVDDKLLRAKLKALDSHLGDLRPAFAEMGEIGRVSIVRNFEVGGRYSAPGGWRGGVEKLATAVGQNAVLWQGKEVRDEVRAVPRWGRGQV